MAGVCRLHDDMARRIFQGNGVAELLWSGCGSMVTTVMFYSILYIIRSALWHQVILIFKL